MNHLFQLLYLAIMTGIIISGTYVMCKSQRVALDSSLREALAWGGCLVLSAGIDYLLIVSGHDYFSLAT